MQEFGLYVLDPEKIVCNPQVHPWRCPPVRQWCVEERVFVLSMVAIENLHPRHLVLEMVSPLGIDSIMIILLESCRRMTFRSRRDFEEYEREDGCVQWQ